MSAISLKSITGITSITTPTGVDDQLTLHNNNTTERVKIDTAGNVHINNHLAVTGVTTNASTTYFDNQVYWRNSGTNKMFTLSNNSGMNWQDDVKAEFGNSGDLKIYNVSSENHIYGSTSQPIIFSTNTNERLRIASNGRVGVGINDPQNYFSSYSNLVVGKASDTGGITIVSASGSGGSIAFAKGTSGNQAYRGLIRYDQSNDSMTFGTDGGLERLRITAAGKVGIGSDDPGATLDLFSNDTEILLRLNTKPVKNGYIDIVSDANRRGVIRFQDSLADGGNYRWSIGNGDSDELSNTSFHISTGNSGGNAAKFAITSAGNVGIGENSPSSKFEIVSGNAASVASGIKLKNDSTSASGPGSSIDFVVDGNNDVTTAQIIGQRTSANYHQGSLQFLTRDSGGAGLVERLRIDSNGRLILGGTSASTYHQDGDEFNIYSTGNTGMSIFSGTSSLGSLFFADDNNDVHGQRRGAIQYNHNGNYLTLWTNAGERLRITSDGKIGIGEDDPDGNQLLIRGPSTFQTNKGHIMLTGDSSTVGQGPQIVFSESGSGSNWAGAYIGHVRQGGGSLGDLVFGTRETTGDASTVPGERLRITHNGDVLIGTNNASSGNRLYVVDNFTDGFINPTDSILRIENANTSGTTTQTSISFTSKTSGSNADSAIVSQAEDASGNSRLEFWTDTSNGMTEKLVLSSTGKLSLTSNDGLFIRPTTDSNDAKITFSTNNNNGNNQIGHIKYNHQDNGILAGYGEGMIMGGTESNGFILRVDGAINIKDSDSAGGDGAKLLFGTDKDMRIYHSGGDGFIDGTGTGGLRIQYNDLIFSNYTQSGTRRVRFHGNEGIEIYAHSNAPSGGIGIKMSDASDFSQYGSIRYEHTNNAVVNDGTDECFVIEGSENQTALKVDGRFYISDSKFVLKPTFSNFDDIPNGTNSGNSVGCMMKYNNEVNGNSGVMSNSAVEPFIANRSGSDGTVIRIRHQGNTEGEIKVNGSSVSYNAFMGSHKAQFVDHSKPDLLIGTVLEVVDQIATWKYASFSVGVGTDATMKYIPYYGSKNDGETDTITFESNTYNATIKNYRDPMPEITKHVCVKVSDTVGSKAVFGVFNAWEEEDVIERESGNAEYAWNDLDVASIGNYFIRMQSGQTPEVGDYVESAGDGTAKVQSDDIFRSKTIAKITSTTKQKIYSDGSFLVTCTLHCG